MWEIDTQVSILPDPSESTRYSEVDPLIFHIEFVREGRGINFYEPGNPIHSWVIDFNPAAPDECGGLLRSHTAFFEGETEDVLYEFEVGMPFRGFHEFADHPSPHGTDFCRYSYLAVAVARAPLPAAAFIIRWDDKIRPRACSHEVDLDRGGRPTHWIPVAFLVGWRRGISSLGTVMAISPGGTCIATATWNRLLIWTLDAELLDQGPMLHYFPDRDYDENERMGVGQLRPTQLSTAGVGVIYRLRWASEVSLFASTEHGLVQWDMGIFSSGKRQTLSLD